MRDAPRDRRRSAPPGPGTLNDALRRIGEQLGETAA
jgi:hypothetical protein